MSMRFIAFIVVIGAIVFFVPKTYTTHPGDVSADEYKEFEQDQKKCLGFKLKVKLKGSSGEQQSMCAGWLSTKDYVDVLDELSQ